MIRLTILALCVILVTSCSDNRDGYNSVRRLHRLINERDLRAFRAIEIYKRGIEFWILAADSTNRAIYTWDSTKGKFSRNGGTIDPETQRHLCALRSRKEELGILEIAQSPWRGEFVKVWCSKSDAGIYLTPSFPLDSEAKLAWKHQFDRGIRLDSTWAYYNIEWDQMSDQDLGQRKAQLTNGDH